jgi:hypothetical protein
MGDRVMSDPRGFRVRVTSAIDATGAIFRVGSEGIFGNAATETFDAGEVDADGRIAVIYTFAGPLADAVAAA